MSPQRFKEELKRFDRRLDFIFNSRKGQWEIIGVDLKHKKYLIAKFKLGELATLGTDFLKDMAAVSPVKSSAKEVNRRIDNIIEAEEKAEAKQQHNAINDKLDESWVHFQYAEGSRVSFATIGVTDKVQIRDKRRFIDDSKRTMAADPKDARDAVSAKTVVASLK